MVDAHTVRTLWRRLEPAHAFIYFAPEAARNYAALGVTGQAGYFASRSAAMGAVGSEVVIATFFNFKPELVRQALPHAWELTTPDAILAARLDSADQALRRMLGELIDHPDLAETATLVRQAAETCRPSGRPLLAAHAALPWPELPHLELFHAVTLLREHRGDGHVAALTLAGYDAIEALLTHAASGELGLPASILQQTRGWSDAEWVTGIERLTARGHLEPSVDGELTLTPEGKERRTQVEAQTDAAAIGPWEALDPEQLTRLQEVSAPFTRAIAKQMFG